MSEKLKEAKGLAVRSTSTTMTTRVKENKSIPKGAKIIDKTVRTETEEIENGYLISKNFDITYEKDGNRGYSYYTKKWFSKTDPLEIKLTDKSLADEFSVDED